MKIGSKLCPMFVFNHKKYKPVFVAGTHVYFFVVRNQRRAEFWTEYHAFFLQSVQNSHGFSVISSLFSIFAQGLKKTHSKWHVSDTQCFSDTLLPIHVSFLKSLGKNQKKWANNPVVLRILNKFLQLWATVLLLKEWLINQSFSVHAKIYIGAPD